MKAVKASKRLIMSIVAFLTSVILCVGAVLAWFVMNDKVDADSASVNVVNGDIVDFTVTVYYLNDATGGYNKAATGNVEDLFGETYNVDYGSDGKLTSDKDSMRPYGGLGNNFATAVLYEIHYEIRVNSANTYRIYASCPEKSTLSVTPLDDNGDTFSSALSNVVAYYNAEASGNLYSKTSNRASSFVQSTNDKDYVLRLQGGIVPSAANNAAGNFEGASYFIMDYLPDNFIYLSSEMIKEGGSLNSGLELFGDLTIHIETYDPVTDPDPIPPDPTEPEEPDEPVGSKEGKIKADDYAVGTAFPSGVSVKSDDGTELFVIEGISAGTPATALPSSVTAEDGEEFSSVFYSGGNNRTLTIVVSSDITLSVYFTSASSADFSSFNSTNIQWNINSQGNVSGKATTGLYDVIKQDIELKAGDRVEISLDSRRFLIFGLKAVTG